MDTCLKDWLDIGIKAFGLIAVIIAALGYFKQLKIKRGEWLQLLFEKFYENKSYKEVRKWLDSEELNQKVNIDDTTISEEDEQFTDFLNFFEFISKLESDGQLRLKDIEDMFDYYLRKLKQSEVSSNWINKYGFEKLKNLLNKIDNE
ncbi:MAG: hypothetical protein ABIO55_03970 [Ginsengibacter sp.]